MASSVFKDDEDINSSPRPFEHEYWIKHFNIDESLFRLCIQANLDYCNDYNISASDIIDVNSQLSPRVVTASPVDYDKYRSNFCWALISAIKQTLQRTT